MTVPPFTAHNIRLDDGRRTIPDAPLLTEEWAGFHSLRRVLDLVFPAGKENHRIADLGCLEGGYSVGFARMGFEAVGIEVRDANFQCCTYVKEHVNLPNLQFVQDNVLNFSRYGRFDTVFCCGLLYHLDQPKAFLEQVAKQTKKLLILDTHFSIESDRVKPHYVLSPMTSNESLKGRWYREFQDNASVDERQGLRWASFHNSQSFWLKREDLLGLIYELGFKTVFEQFDYHAPDITKVLTESYEYLLRGRFIGIR